MKTYEGKVVLITGAGGGIGQAIALAFAEQGAKLVLIDLKEEFLSKLIAKLPKTTEYFAAGADVKDYDSYQTIVSTAVDKFGVLDVVVNNAGVVGIGSIEEITPDEWDRVLTINAKGVFVGTKVAIEFMKKQGSGAIINTASIAGKMGMAHLSHYVASKFAVIGFSNSIAKEVASTGITVNCLCPGIVGTGMWRGEGGIADRWKLEGETEEQSWERNKVNLIPQGIDQTSDDMAQAVLYIASAKHLTGQAIAVDGGMTM